MLVCLQVKKSVYFLALKFFFWGGAEVFFCTVLAKENKYFLTFRLNDNSSQNNNKHIQY